MDSPSTAEDIILNQIINGLRANPKTLPSKLFYDERGSKLFDQICELDEYYPTKTESKILADNIEDIAEVFCEGTLFIEFGSGSSLKTRLLLTHIKNLAGYIPIDISEGHLLLSVKALQVEYPDLDIYPMAADYTQPLEFPPIKKRVKHKIAFFPGSTIGNFRKDAAKKFLSLIASECGENGGLLIGVDLKKDKKVLEKAYNDSDGITSEFNLNILKHINRAYEFNFNIDNFEHLAFFNEEEGRIEMHLQSLRDQTVSHNGVDFHIKNGETILTEYSHKYTLESFAELASEHFSVKKVWTDPENYFSVQYLETK